MRERENECEREAVVRRIEEISREADSIDCGDFRRSSHLVVFHTHSKSSDPSAHTDSR